jgi:hypothetical protein
LAAAVALAFGAGWGLYAKFGAYWPTEPAIAPSAAGAAESSPVSPFAVKNDSVLFPMEGVKFTCFLNAALFKIGDEKGWTMAKVGPAEPGTLWKKSDGAAIDIPTGKTVNYFCGVDEMIRDVQINRQSARLRGMQVRIGVDYTVDLSLLVWRRHYDSDAFTCDVEAGKCQWFIGELVH